MKTCLLILFLCSSSIAHDSYLDNDAINVSGNHNTVNKTVYHSYEVRVDTVYVTVTDTVVIDRPVMPSQDRTPRDLGYVTDW